MMKVAVLAGALIMCIYGFAQDMPPQRPGMEDRKGQGYIYWGYNRAYYNKSDIHFRGENFNFTLHDVRAEDMPEKFNPDVYFNVQQLTIPQFNFRAGYYIGKNTSISAGWDHMKYHIIQTQLVTIDGEIEEEAGGMPGYTGVFDHERILYTPSFMDYHHSDGFNYIRVGLEQRAVLWASRNGVHALTIYGGVSAGAMMPWTDFTLFGQRHRNRPHFAGYGLSANLGGRMEFFRWFFLQVNAQAGWTHLGDILLEDDLPSRARQNISFFERSWAIGGYIPLQRADKTP
jgi:hypothetical protein